MVSQTNHNILSLPFEKNFVDWQITHQKYYFKKWYRNFYYSKPDRVIYRAIQTVPSHHWLMEMVEEILSHQQHPQSFMKNAAVGWRDELPKKYIFVGINLFLLHVLNLYKSQYSIYQPKSTRQWNVVNPKSLWTFVRKEFGHLVNLRNAKIRFSLFQDILIIYYTNQDY